MERDDLRRTGSITAVVCMLACGAWLLSGCSSASAGAHAGASCGTTKTAADVPVLIKVARGMVDCATALRIENEYAAKIRSGQVPGNGGGAPVKVGGWTCQGYNTPEVLSTGNASQCHTAGTAILAVLAVATSSGTAS